MTLSKNSSDNETVDELLGQLIDKVEEKTAESSIGSPSEQSETFFQSFTEGDMTGVRREFLNDVGKELLYAANRAGVNISETDLAKFATDAWNNNTRGRNLELQARGYCRKLADIEANPKPGTTRVAGNSETDRFNPHRITSGSFVPNENRQGYIGMSKSPNSIWDSEAIIRLAQEKGGDEKIKESHQARQDYKEAQKFKERFQRENKEAPMDTGVQRSASALDGMNERNDPPVSGLRILSEDRDFNNVPDLTEGEKIKARRRDEKVAKAKKELEILKGTTKVDNSASSLFGINEPSDGMSSIERKGMDNLFGGGEETK